jgi:ATP citrate (pro-S)-lyase
MIDIEALRNTEAHIISLGSHPGIIQTILDFDWLAGKESPSVKAVIAAGRKSERYYWGKDQILLPVYESEKNLPSELRDRANFILNVSSGRRTLSSTQSALAHLPKLVGGNLFAEEVPEQHSLSIKKTLNGPERQRFLVGPASVGLLIPSILKLGAIAGVQMKQLLEARVFTAGNVAVFSASGGMTNEIINILAQKEKHLSFALSIGGDRFPVVSPAEAFLAAEADPQTDYIVYYGELGGDDEYKLVDMINEGKITKPILAYIAGSVADMFEVSPQFGHAKAMAKTADESAAAKRKALREVGVKAADSFAKFMESLDAIEQQPKRLVAEADLQQKYQQVAERSKKLFMSSVSGENEGEVEILGQNLLEFAANNSFGQVVAGLLLGRPAKSEILPQLMDFLFKLLADHGPYQSGVVNTMISARAGKDMVSSLSAGLLTIGPRFGGAINDAAGNWLAGVAAEAKPAQFVEEFASQRKYIPGIGHKKYRLDNPDPRVEKLLAFTESLEHRPHVDFAQAVAKVTTAKKANLILNVDGTISAVMLDILQQAEGYSTEELKQLVEIEFFNALFVLPRSLGFVAHFLDQKRIDEGLFRLSPETIAKI